MGTYTTVKVHCFYDGPGLLAAVHASAALGGPEAWLEWRYFDLEAQLYGDAIVPKKGAMAVPQSPGLGLEPSADVIRKPRLLIGRFVDQPILPIGGIPLIADRSIERHVAGEPPAQY